ncbi:hypothetical protein QQ045_033686 [Rhodiola kirilowii]
MLRALAKRTVAVAAACFSQSSCRNKMFLLFQTRAMSIVVLPDGVDRTSEAFEANLKVMEGLNSELKSHIDKVMAGGGAEAVKRNRSRLPRDMIERLIDPGTSFLELSQLAGHGLYEDKLPSAGIITGIWTVHGRLCMFVANGPTVKGGTYYPNPITVKKHLRAQEIAAKCKLPCIYLVDSGGAFLPKQAEVFPDKENFGRIFDNQATMSAEDIPQIALVLGSCTAGGAYIPEMADESVMVKGNRTIFLAGPPLFKAATGEEVSAEDLGGAVVHCKTSGSGVSDYLAQDELHGLAIGRNIVKNLHMAAKPGNDMVQSAALEYQEPLYDILTLVTGFARVYGHPVGIIGNNRILFNESALKGVHFIELCAQRKIPLIFLQNITGFMGSCKPPNKGPAKPGRLAEVDDTCNEIKSRGPLNETWYSQSYHFRPKPTVYGRSRQVPTEADNIRPRPTT